MTSLAFTVYGESIPQGSARPFTYRRSVEKGGGIGARVDSDNPRLKGWRQLVAESASLALNRMPASERGLITVGVRLTVAFYLQRPKSLAKRVTAHMKKPDLDKCIRSICDALSKVVFQDDNQVCEIVAAKHYAAEGQPPRVDIRVDVTAGTQPIAVPASPLPLFERTPDGRTERTRSTVGW